MSVHYEWILVRGGEKNLIDSLQLVLKHCTFYVSEHHREERRCAVERSGKRRSVCGSCSVCFVFSGVFCVCCVLSLMLTLYRLMKISFESESWRKENYIYMSLESRILEVCRPTKRKRFGLGRPELFADNCCV